MGVDGLLLLLAALITAAILLHRLAARLYLPFAATLLVTGFLGSELAVGLGADLSLDARNIHDIAVYGLIPLLVFGAAMRMDTTTLREHLAPIAILALPMPLVTCVLIAALVYWGVGHPTGFPWLAALFTGAILTATEPFPLLLRLTHSPMGARLRVLLEAEGLINIAIAVNLFVILAYLASHPEEDPGWGDLIIRFLWMLGGGGVLGVIASLLALSLSRRFQSPE
ncbi:MAG: cation:proton antiporter, partial [Pseudomonadota bacterium]